MKLLSLLLPLTFGLFGSACSSDGPVDIGSDETAKTGDTLADYAASWDGHVEAYAFPSGSDRVRLTLDETGNGVLTIGEDWVPWPAPTDPDDGYPPDFVFGGTIANRPPGYDELLEGFPFTTQQTVVEDRRVRLGAELKEPYRPWCELQQSYLIGPPQGYSCIRGGSFSGGGPPGGPFDCSYADVETAVDVVVDCEKAMLCMLPTCECNADGCGMPSHTSLDEFGAQLDAGLEAAGNELVGTLLLPERVNVRLYRH